MIYEWHTDQHIPAGSVISVGDGRFLVAAPGPRLLLSVVLPPTEKEQALTERVRELEAVVKVARDAVNAEDDIEDHLIGLKRVVDDLPAGP